MQAFAENMLLCGGGSRVPGLSAKFAGEMQSVSPASLQPAMCTSPDYMPEKTLHYSSWMGAAILSKVSDSSTDEITRQLSCVRAQAKQCCCSMLMPKAPDLAA